MTFGINEDVEGGEEEEEQKVTQHTDANEATL